MKTILAWIFVIILFSICIISIIGILVSMILANPILMSIIIGVIIISLAGSWGLHHLGLVPEETDQFREDISKGQFRQ